MCPVKPAADAGLATKPSLTLKRRLNAAPGKSLRRVDRPEKTSAAGSARDGQSPARCRPTSTCASAGATASASARKTASIYEVGGVYREVVPNQRLVFSWAWHSTPERESLVTVTLKPDGGGTLLTLHHEQFFDQAARDSHEQGWTEHARQAGKASRLKRFNAEEPSMQPHKIVSREEWIEARKAHLAHEKEYTRRARPAERGTPRAALGQGRQGLRVRRPATARRRWPICSRAAASWWCSISCSRPTGTKAARAARSGPTASSA